MTLIIVNAYARGPKEAVYFEGELGLGKKGAKIPGTTQYEKDLIADWPRFCTDDFSIPINENGEVLSLEPFRDAIRNQYVAITPKCKVYVDPKTSLKTWFSAENPIRVDTPDVSLTIKTCKAEQVNSKGELVRSLKLLVSYHNSPRTPLSGEPATSF